MIKSVTIRDAGCAPYAYIADIPALKEGTTIEFKPGINIIVGANGCGKSTLIKTIATYLLCGNGCMKTPTGYNSVRDAANDRHLWDPTEAEKLLDGVDVAHDYNGVAFILRNSYEMEEGDALRDMDSFVSAYKRRVSSMGENTMFSIQTLFDVMFADKGVEYLAFPVANLKKIMDNAGDVWKERIRQLLQYYKRNQVTDLTPEDFQYTVLMDEPDRNLDIYNLDQVADILSQDKEMTQLIATVHNPLLIARLSQKPNVNIIEMTEGYVNAVHTEIFKSRRIQV